MDGSEEICFKLKLAENKLVVARKAVDKGAESPRKEEEKRKAAKVEAHRLREEGNGGAPGGVCCLEGGAKGRVPEACR